MARFRFRAAAALDLRRQQETAAAIALAREEAACREAEKLVNAAIANRQTAEADLEMCARTGGDIGTIEWHRNWIVRLAFGVDAARRDLDAQAVVVRAAETAWREARKRRLGLERMRDRALARFAAVERQAEQAGFDELARIRYLMSGDERGVS